MRMSQADLAYIIRKEADWISFDTDDVIHHKIAMAFKQLADAIENWEEE